MLQVGSRSIGESVKFCCKDYCIFQPVREPPYDLDCSCSCWAIRVWQKGEVTGQDEDGNDLYENPIEFWFSEKPMLKKNDLGYSQVPAVIMEGYSYSARAFSGEEPKGRGTENIGKITLANCGEVDEFACLEWDLQNIEVYASDCCDKNVDDMTLIFAGVTKEIQKDSITITIPFGDRRSGLEKSSIEERFDGVSILNGGETLEGKIKPKTFGTVFNISPILVDATDQIYQIHNGEMQQVNEVRDNGVPLSYAGDVSNILTATVPAGFYVTDLMNGYIKLGSPPIGEITVDAIGSVPLVQTTSEVLIEILTNCFGDQNLTYPDDFDLFSLNFFQIQTAFPIGYFLSEDKSMAQILDELVQGVGGFWYFSRDGKLAFGLPWATDEIVCEPIDNDDIIGNVQFESVGKGSSGRTVKWKKNWTVQDNLAAGADQSLVPFWEADYLNSNSGDQGGLTNVEIETFISSQVAADKLSSTLFEYYKDKRDFIQITVDCGLLKFRLNDCVALDLDRFKINGDKNFQIIALEENAKSNCVRLRLAG